MTIQKYYVIVFSGGIMGQVFLPQILCPAFGNVSGWILTYVILVILVMLFAGWFIAQEKDKS